MADEKTLAMLLLGIIGVVSIWVFGDKSLNLIEIIVTGILTMTNVGSKQ